MPNFIRLIIWDAIFFLVISVGYAGSQAVDNRTIAFVIILLTCAACGALLARLSIWGIYWVEIVFVGLPALYLAVCPLLAPFVSHLSFLPFPLVPQALLKESAMVLHVAGALIFGFMMRHMVH